MPSRQGLGGQKLDPRTVGAVPLSPDSWIVALKEPTVPEQPAALRGVLPGSVPVPRSQPPRFLSGLGGSHCSGLSYLPSYTPEEGNLFSLSSWFGTFGFWQQMVGQSGHFASSLSALPKPQPQITAFRETEASQATGTGEQPSC